MEATEESCLEDVLASLPDIDDSKLFLPRIGSFNALNDELDCVIDSCCTSNAYIPANNNINIAHIDPRVQDHYSRSRSDAALQKEMKPSSKQPVNADFEAVKDQLQSCVRQESNCNYLEEVPHDQDLLLLRANNKLNDRIQTFPTLRETRKMIGSCYMQENDVQSTCRFPIISDNNLQHQHHHPQEINVAHGLPPTRMQGSEYTQSRLHSINCITKLESGLEIFPKINGFYVQSYN